MVNDETKEITYSLDREKAIVVYLCLAKKYKDNRSKIKFDKFEKAWNEMFVPNIRSYQQPQKQKLNKVQRDEFTFVKSNFAAMTLDEIKEYRDKFKIYDGATVPAELRRIAMEKDVLVVLSPTTEKHLSGFDIQVKDKQAGKTYSLIKVPYILTEEAARQKLESLPTKAELVRKEELLKGMLQGNEIVDHKKKAVQRYQAPYATHNFKKFMNKYTIHQCDNKQLTLFCVELCHRVGIENMSNLKPIEYGFCEGSGKRAKAMRGVKNANNQRKKSQQRKKARK